MDGLLNVIGEFLLFVTPIAVVVWIIVMLIIGQK